MLNCILHTAPTAASVLTLTLIEAMATQKTIYAILTLYFTISALIIWTPIILKKEKD
jgi:hypothetical protein